MYMNVSGDIGFLVGQRKYIAGLAEGHLTDYFAQGKCSFSSVCNVGYLGYYAFRVPFVVRSENQSTLKCEWGTLLGRRWNWSND